MEFRCSEQATRTDQHVVAKWFPVFEFGNQVKNQFLLAKTGETRSGEQAGAAQNKKGTQPIKFWLGDGKEEG